MIVSRPQRRGISLMELIAVMGALGAALTIGILLLYSIMGLQRFSGHHHQRIVRHAILAVRFREDVHAAIEAPERFKDFKAGVDCLILKQRDDHYIVYRFVDASLERIDGEHRQMIPLNSKAAVVTFTRTGGPFTLLTLTLSEPQKNRPAIPLVFTARLGGARR